MDAVEYGGAANDVPEMPVWKDDLGSHPAVPCFLDELYRRKIVKQSAYQVF